MKRQWGLKLCLSSMLLLSMMGCQKSDDTAEAAKTASQAASSSSQIAVSQQATLQQAASQSATTRQPIIIDWSKIDSGIKPVDKQRFNYPFELDSAPVKAYAQMYHVDNATARYNLTVGMAVNEILNKVLDQIGTAYVSHELTAGNDSQFIIHTTKTVAPSKHDYVFAEPFAKGLTMTVQVINDGDKSATNAQAFNPHASAIIP